MSKHVIAALRTVSAAFRVGMSGARRRQCFEAETLQVARAADIPRIGNDEAAGLMKGAEGFALVGG